MLWDNPGGLICLKTCDHYQDVWDLTEDEKLTRPKLLMRLRQEEKYDLWNWNSC